MEDFQDTFETRKQSLTSAFSIFMTVPLSTFFINGKSAFSNSPRILSRNPSDCTSLDS